MRTTTRMNVRVTVTAVNDGAATFGGNLSGTGLEDGGAITGTLTASDPDGAGVNPFAVTGAASNGTASINAATGAWSYTPNADYNGADSFTVTYTDAQGFTSTQVISMISRKVERRRCFMIESLRMAAT